MKMINRLLRRDKGKYSFQNLTPIINEGAMSMPFFGDGRLIPALVLNCEKCPEILNFFFLDDDGRPGDAISTWARDKNDADYTYVYLILDFIRPVEAQIVIPFDVSTQGGLVEGIISSRGVFLQPQEVGITVSAGFGKEQKLIEIPATTTFPTWDKIYSEKMFKEFRNQGNSKKAARSLADEHIRLVRDIWRKRPVSAE